jgi:hypothetical protein
MELQTRGSAVESSAEPGNTGVRAEDAARPAKDFLA